MKKFLEEHELEVLLILITMVGVARWWIPPVWGFENMYGASHWALSYDYGLVRRGLVGAIVKLWMPMVTIEGVERLQVSSRRRQLAVSLDGEVVRAEPPLNYKIRKRALRVIAP